MKSFLCFSTLLFLGVFGFNINAQSIKKEKFEVNNDIGYAEAIKVDNTIYVSGSVGWGNMNDAMKLAYESIAKALKNYNANFENVVKENLYTTALDSVIKYKDIRRNYYLNNDYPAATWVEVKRLYNAGLVVEIEVVAVLPDKK